MGYWPKRELDRYNKTFGLPDPQKLRAEKVRTALMPGLSRDKELSHLCLRFLDRTGR